jgi:hypothetical protein
MRSHGGIIRTGVRYSAFVTAALAATTCATAQDPWTVPPSASVLIDPENTTVGIPGESSRQVVGDLTPLDNGGYSVGDAGSANEEPNRFDSATPSSVAVEDPSAPPLAYAIGGYGGDGCTGHQAGCTDGLGGDCCPPDDPWCSVHHKKTDVCWIGRADALLLFRDAPPDRPLVESGVGALSVLNANQMDSPLAAGPRFSLFRFNTCNGTGIEATYLRAANWRSQRFLPVAGSPYALSPPGIYANDNTQNFDTGSANLGAAIQSFELNRHWCKGEHLRFLAGFRWVEWRESFSLSDTFNGSPAIQDFYQTDCTNSLYGGQIGLDAWLLTLPWMRIDSLIKAGAYYNNAVQDSLYQSNATGPLLSQSIAVDESPLNCAFVGELGITGVVPLASWLDLRVGYFGMWLSGIAQPTQQLSGQVLTVPAGGTDPAVGSINANGSTLVQGVSLGLEGRW